MVTGMTHILRPKNRLRMLNSYTFGGVSLLLSTLLLTACQPPNSADTASIERTQAELPIVIDDNTVTMSSDYILSIKQSRYQPSLGLQGIIEPTKQARFIAAQALGIEKVLVTEGQWVEKGTPLLILYKQDTSKAVLEADKNTSEPENNLSSNSLKATKQLSNGESQQNNAGSKNNSLDKEKADNSTVNDEAESKMKSAKAEQASFSPVGNGSNSAQFDNEANKNRESNLNETVKNEPAKDTASPLIIRASFSGRIDKLPATTGQQLEKGKLLLRIIDDNHLRFIAKVPIQVESQLSVGQTVNFSSQDHNETFTGQVSKLVPSEGSDQLLVYVQVIKNEASRNTLKVNTLVSGRVNYGQIEVGAIVPARGIHDVDLTALQKPPYKPLAPLLGNIWIIQQDQRLTRQSIEVIEYDPSTKQYLIAGISNDSLICLADLPVESAGKKVIVS